MGQRGVRVGGGGMSPRPRQTRNKFRGIHVLSALFFRIYVFQTSSNDLSSSLKAFIKSTRIFLANGFIC